MDTPWRSLFQSIVSNNQQDSQIIYSSALEIDIQNHNGLVINIDDIKLIASSLKLVIDYWGKIPPGIANAWSKSCIILAIILIKATKTLDMSSFLKYSKISGYVLAKCRTMTEVCIYLKIHGICLIPNIQFY
jgi:hypothetical protein